MVGKDISPNYRSSFDRAAAGEIDLHVWRDGNNPKTERELGVLVLTRATEVGSPTPAVDILPCHKPCYYDGVMPAEEALQRAEDHKSAISKVDFVM